MRQDQQRGSHRREIHEKFQGLSESSVHHTDPANPSDKIQELRLRLLIFDDPRPLEQQRVIRTSPWVEIFFVKWINNVARQV